MPLLVPLGWFAAWLLLLRLPTLRKVADARSTRVPADLSIIIPARNEQDRLPLLLASLQAQTLMPAQVLVIDDNSDDSTAASARAFDGVEVLQATPPPEGWTGKSWACVIGVNHAVGSRLIFLDADVRLAPDALAAVDDALHKHRGLVSVQPRHQIHSPVEAASMPFNIVGLMALGIGSLIPPRTQWGAAGPCMASSKEDYELVGGHGATRGAIAEDLELAALYGRAGLPVHCVGGGDLVSFRMYRNFGEIVVGWSKNMASGARRSPWLRTLGITLWIAAMLQATFLLLRVPGSDNQGIVSAGVVYAGFTLQWFVLGRQVGRFRLGALLWPVMNVFFVTVVILSALQTVLLRRVTWSGRRVRVGPRVRIGDGPS
ncbi:MAG: glycosyltransferase family A protein [Microthrixaceae bacterium]